MHGLNEVPMPTQRWGLKVLYSASSDKATKSTIETRKVDISLCLVIDL